MNEPTSHNEVEVFERTNKIKHPTSYVELLRFFDGGNLFIPGTTFMFKSWRGRLFAKRIKQEREQTAVFQPKLNVVFLGHIIMEIGYVLI